MASIELLIVTESEDVFRHLLMTQAHLADRFRMRRVSDQRDCARLSRTRLLYLVAGYHKSDAARSVARAWRYRGGGITYISEEILRGDEKWCPMPPVFSNDDYKGSLERFRKSLEKYIAIRRRLYK